MKNFVFMAGKKALKILLLGIGGALIIIYGMDYVFPKTWKQMGDATTAKHTNKINHVKLMGKYGLDQNLKNSTTFTWNRVCLFKDYTWKGHLPEKQIQYAEGYDVVYKPEVPLFVLNKQKEYQWVFLFTDSRTKKARWIDPCNNNHCIKISSLQEKEECFDTNVVLRPVYHMCKDNKATLKYLVTHPEENMPANKNPKAGKHQNPLRVPFIKNEAY
jgi:hypothetical protein